MAGSSAAPGVAAGAEAPLAPCGRSSSCPFPIPSSRGGLTGHIPAQGSALPGGLAQWHREAHFQLWLLGLQPASDSSQRLLIWGRKELPKQRGEGAAAPKAPQGHIPCERRAQGILQPPCPGAEARLASRNCIMSNTHCRPQAFLPVLC